MTPRQILSLLLVSAAAGLARLASRVAGAEGREQARSHRVPVEPHASPERGLWRDGGAVRDEVPGKVATVYIPGIGPVMVACSDAAHTVTRGGVA